MLDKKRCPFPTRSPMLATTTTPFASPNPPSSVGFTQAPAIFCPGCFILVSLRSARQFRGNTFTLPYVHCIPFFLMYVAPHNTPPQVCSSCQSVFVLADVLLCIWDPFGCAISPQHGSAVHVSTLPQHFPYCNMRGQH